MLVNTKEMLLHAASKGYAVAQPNAWDMHSLRAVIRASQTKNTPVIIGLAEVHLQYIDLEEMVAMVRYYSSKSDIPLALHLDHGNTYGTIVRAIRSGFTSVMIDASSESFENNCRYTSEIVKIAHECGVCVEAELGHVGSGNEYDKVEDAYTDPHQASKFVKETGIDSLAIAIGTAHGVYKGKPKIDFNRLNEIKSLVDIPLVLHGGSSTGDGNLTKCVNNGISKINIATDLMIAASNKVKEKININYIDLGIEGENAIKDCLEHYFDVFGCSGHARDIEYIKKFNMVSGLELSGQF